MSELVGLIGETPVVEVTNIRPPENEIYERLYELPQYRQTSPGQKVVIDFLQQAQPRPGAHVIDIGCGTGRAGLAMHTLGNLKVTLLDFASNAVDKEILEAGEMDFIQHDITKKFPLVTEYGFCSDVLEHIAPELVNEVLNNALLACKHLYIQIATVDEIHQHAVGHPLHLTIRPYEWWLERFVERGCLIHYSKKTPTSCIFYVTGWATGADVVDAGRLNTTEEQIIKNVKHNIAQGWQQVTPYPTNDIECMILGGSPSLNAFEAEIRQKREEGVKIISINGTYKWCLDHGIIPSALIMVDARPHNARFSKPVIDGCKYFIASQCDPSVFEGLPKDRTYIWHTSAELIGKILTEHYGEWYPIPGGSTALLRALPLFRMLGFKKFHLYGCDSCISSDAHHAYPQAENDTDVVIPIMVHPDDRVFQCHTWMASQAQEFIDLIKFIGDELDIEIHGDGLLAHILNVGAKLADEEELKINTLKE